MRRNEGLDSGEIERGSVQLENSPWQQDSGTKTRMDGSFEPVSCGQFARGCFDQGRPCPRMGWRATWMVRPVTAIIGSPARERDRVVWGRTEFGSTYPKGVAGFARQYKTCMATAPTAERQLRVSNPKQRTFRSERVFSFRDPIRSFRENKLELPECDSKPAMTAARIRRMVAYRWLEPFKRQRLSAQDSRLS